MKSYKNQYIGFTLVEIIVAMSILAIASSAIIGLMGNLEEARELSEDDSMIQIQFNHIENYIRNHIDPTTDVQAGVGIEYDDWNFTNPNPGIIKLRYSSRDNMTQNNALLTTDTNADVVINIDRDEINNVDGFIDDIQEFTLEFYLKNDSGSGFTSKGSRTIYTTTENYFMP